MSKFARMAIVGLVFMIAIWGSALAQNVEVEPNDHFAAATVIGVNDTVKFRMSGGNDVDVVKMTLDANYSYYISGYKYDTQWDLCESQTNNGNADRAPYLEAEWYAASDTTKIIPLSELAGGYRYGMPRNTGYVPPATGAYYLKLYTFDSDVADYWIRVVQGPKVADLGVTHEPDSTTALANAQPLLKPFEPILADVYPINDLDIFKLEGVAGQTFDITVYPPPGLAHRDIDTDIALFDQNGPPSGNVKLDGLGIASNDDYRSGITWSRIQGRFPYTGTYYLAVFTWYSKYADQLNYPYNSLHANQGHYLVTYKLGVAEESEPNNTFANATYAALNDTVKVHISGDQDVDVFRMTLSKNHIYYISTYKYGNEWDLIESGTENGNRDRVPFLEAEVYFASDTTKQISPAGEIPGGNRFGMIRLAGWVPQETGDYFIKLYTYDTTPADYYLRVVEGPWAIELGKKHEPDNTTAAADTRPMLTPFAPITADLYPINDLDVYKLVGEKGKPFEITVFPPAWVAYRDIDTDIALFDANGVPAGDVKLDGQGLYSNDDMTSGITWSKIKGVFPYTGNYYLAVFTWYSKWADRLDYPNDALRANQGEYIVTLKVGTEGEQESNGAFKNATYVAVNDTVKAHISGDQDVDIFRMSLNKNHIYYISTYKYGNEWDLIESGTENGNRDRVPYLEAEIYSANDTTKQISPAGEIPGGNRFGMIRLTGWVPQETGDYFIKLYTFDTTPSDYYLRVVEGPVINALGKNHEPDNTMADAKARPMLKPFEPILADVFPVNDLDIYKVVGEKGKPFEITVFPPKWLAYRDIDTDIALFDSTGVPPGNVKLDGQGLYSNDDMTSGITWSKINGVFPYTGSYYLAVFTWYSKWADRLDYPNDALHANQGEYLVTLRVGSAREQEPNNTPAKATYLAVNDTLLMFCGGDVDTDYVRITLNKNQVYYFTSFRDWDLWKNAEEGWKRYPKAASPNLEVEAYLASDPNVKFAHISRPSNANERGMFRWSSMIPPESGDWIFRFYTFDTDTTTYWMYLNEGPKVAELATLHEPDNNKAQADAKPLLGLGESARGTLYPAGNDIDIYRVQATAGDSFEVWVKPTAKQGYRDVDTYLIVWKADGVTIDTTKKIENTGLFENDDYVSGITWSRVTGKWPASGTYYLGVTTWYSRYLDNPNAPVAQWNDPTLANVGEYIISYSQLKPTGVNDNVANLPAVFALRQNYPNPFNPSTTIEYDLPKATKVQITIYNVLGARVKTLVDEQKPAGRYNVVWDAKNERGVAVSTGIYFYQIKAGDFNTVKKLMLIK